MGATASTSSTTTATNSSTIAKSKGADEETVVRLLLPVYFTNDVITPEDIELVAKSWKLISANQSPVFLHMKKADPASVSAQSSIEYFGDEFARRFLEVHPLAKSMFTKSTMKQGSLFARMISFTVKALDDTEKFDKTFATLTTSHNRMGVRAVEYGIFGEVLFFTLRKTLGTDVYTPVVHYAWVKVMSRILRVMIPIVVRYEVTLVINEKTAGDDDSVGSGRSLQSNRGATQRGYQPHQLHDSSSSRSHVGEGEAKSNSVQASSSTAAH